MGRVPLPKAVTHAHAWIGLSTGLVRPVIALVEISEYKKRHGIGTVPKVHHLMLLLRNSGVHQEATRQQRCDAHRLLCFHRLRARMMALADVPLEADVFMVQAPTGVRG